MPEYSKQLSIFARHFVNSSSLCDVDCVCGRVHFTSAHGHGDYNEGELDRLKELAQSNPEKYIEESEYDYVDIAYICGHTVVVDCPCRIAERFALFLVGHAEQCAKLLAELLSSRAQELSDDEKRIRELAAVMSVWPPFHKVHGPQL